MQLLDPSTASVSRLDEFAFRKLSLWPDFGQLWLQIPCDEQVASHATIKIIAVPQCEPKRLHVRRDISGRYINSQ